MLRPLQFTLTLLLSACGATVLVPPTPGIEVEPAMDVVLIGEQHDATAHHAQERAIIETLTSRGRLAALVLEMADEGRSTAALHPRAEEADVRAALGWNEAAWKWRDYGPAIMAAVRAGRPVVGGNLRGAETRNAMADGELDALLSGPAFLAQQEVIREGHCGLLPESQLRPMARVQIARDRAMARTLAQAAIPGKTVVLLAGAGHINPALGVPQHLPRRLQVQVVPLPAQPQQADYCAGLRERMKGGSVK